MSLIALNFALFALAAPPQERTPVATPQFVLTLIDDLGQPLSDIPVGLGMAQSAPGSWRWNGLMDAPRRTDAEGRLALAPRKAWVEGATLAVDLREANVTGDHYERNDVPWNGGAGEHTLVVPRPGWIVGRVTRRATSDLVFAAIGVFEEEYGSSLELDAEGRFRIGPIAAGRHTVKFHYERADQTVEFEVAPGAATDEVLVDLNRGGWIVGRVLDHEGRPLGAGHLSLAAPEQLDLDLDVFFDGLITIDAVDGRFVTGPLQAGLWPIQYYPPRAGPPLAHAWVEVPASGDVEIELRTPGPAIEVTGVVRRGGRGLADVNVELRTSGTMHSESALTDAEGRYTLRVPRPGVYDVRAAAYHGGEVIVKGPRHTLDVAVPVNALVIEPPNMGDATRTWWFDIHPVALDARPNRSAASTERTPRPRLTDIAPGRYRVNARQGPEVLVSTVVTVPDAGEVSATFTVVPRGRLQIEAVDGAGNAVTAPQTQCFDSEGLWVSHFNHLMPGTYDLWITTPGLAGLASVQVVGEATAVARVTLLPAASLEITGEQQGRAVPPFLQLVSEHGHVIDAVEHRLVNGPGRVRINGVPPGTYRLRTRVPGAAWQERAIVLTAGQHVALSLRFE